MPRPKKPRKSLSLRLQPYEGTPLAQVTEYLNNLDKEELRRQLSDALVAFFYPYALKETCDSEVGDLRNSFLISRDIANKHFGIMALALNLDAIVVASIVNSGISGGAWEDDRPQDNNQSKPIDSSKELDEMEDLIEINTSTSEVRDLFGF